MHRACVPRSFGLFVLGCRRRRQERADGWTTNCTAFIIHPSIHPTPGLVELGALRTSAAVRTKGLHFVTTQFPAAVAKAIVQRDGEGVTSRRDSESRNFPTAVPVLAVHWRRDDFVALRSSQRNVLVDPEQLVEVIR